MAGTPQPIRAGGNVQRLHLIRKASPAYPADAQAERVEGTVLLRAVVSKEGSMLHVTPISDVDQRRVSAAVWRGSAGPCVDAGKTAKRTGTRLSVKAW